jgi:hypothetical protein
MELLNMRAEIDLYFIVLPHMGQLFPNERNVNKAICQVCHLSGQPGELYRFKIGHIGLSYQSRRNNGMSNGYFCQSCGADVLKAAAAWKFDPENGVLFQSKAAGGLLIDGLRLGDLFRLNGAAGLAAAILEAGGERA